jgi:hypothetical protein
LVTVHIDIEGIVGSGIIPVDADATVASIGITCNETWGSDALPVPWALSDDNCNFLRLWLWESIRRLALNLQVHAPTLLPVKAPGADLASLHDHLK